MKKGRPPRSDELELWRKVAQTAEPMDKAQTAIPPEVPDTPKAGPKLAGLPKKLAQSTQKPTAEKAQSAPAIQMDRKTFSRMSKGRLQPEARLDLHGLTLDRAHSALTRFILSQHASGRRLVLVITGKGKERDDGGPIPVRFGVLRHQVPQWLSLPPLAGLILQVSQSHQKHGGSGAYYVYLKRSR